MKYELKAIQQTAIIKSGKKGNLSFFLTHKKASNAINGYTNIAIKGNGITQNNRGKSNVNKLLHDNVSFISQIKSEVVHAFNLKASIVK
jgi:hypothetical protein